MDKPRSERGSRGILVRGRPSRPCTTDRPSRWRAPAVAGLIAAAVAVAAAFNGHRQELERARGLLGEGAAAPFGHDAVDDEKEREALILRPAPTVAAERSEGSGEIGPPAAARMNQPAITDPLGDALHGEEQVLQLGVFNVIADKMCGAARIAPSLRAARPIAQDSGIGRSRSREEEIAFREDVSAELGHCFERVCTASSSRSFGS